MDFIHYRLGKISRRAGDNCLKLEVSTLYRKSYLNSPTMSEWE